MITHESESVCGFQYILFTKVHFRKEFKLKATYALLIHVKHIKDTTFPEMR